MRARAILLPLALAAAWASCVQILGDFDVDKGGGDGDGGEAAGGESYPDCPTCANGECGGEVTACENNNECVGLYDCIAARRADPDTCYQTYPNGVVDYEALRTCVCYECPEICGC